MLPFMTIPKAKWGFAQTDDGWDWYKFYPLLLTAHAVWGGDFYLSATLRLPACKPNGPPVACEQPGNFLAHTASLTWAPTVVGAFPLPGTSSPVESRGS